MYSISFMYRSNQIIFEESSLKDIYTEFLDWLDENGYSFSGDVHNTFNRKILTRNEVDELSKNYNVGKGYHKNHFYNINGKDKFILYNDISVGKILPNILKMLKNFGINEHTIKTSGFTTSRIKKFGEDIPDLDEDDLTPIEEEPVNKIKVYKQNPFRQSLCVVGDPGAGKSQTMLNILENEGHKTLLFIPTELSTSMVVQYSEGRLRLNRLGSFIIRAYEQPDTLFTVLIDEFHKPMTIKRVNDELLQAISTSRYSGNRFLTLEVAEELMEEKLKSLGLNEDDYLYHSNIRIPDNLGFVLLTSKPSVIVDNKDIYDRVNIAEIRRDYYDEMTRESRVKNLSDLSGIILKTKEEKDKFKEELKSRDI